MNQLGLASAYADTTIASAPQSIIDAITKATIPDAEVFHDIPTKEEKVITKDSVIKPAKHVMELVTNTGEREAQPIRMPASAFFNINSIDRYASAQNPVAQFALVSLPVAELNATPASAYEMYLGRNLMAGYFYRLTVTDANIQWNIPTINSQNDTFSMTNFVPGSGTYTIRIVTLIHGYYTFTELAVELQRAIIAAFASSPTPMAAFVVNWSFPGAALEEVQATSGYCYNFYTADPDIEFIFNATLLGQSNQLKTRAMFKLYHMLGITTVGTSNYTIYFSALASYPTLIYTSYVDIISNKLSQFMRVKDSETSWAPDTSVITRIYLTNQGTITAPTVTPTGATTGGVPAVGATTTFDTYAVGSRSFILNYTPTTPKYIKWDPAQALIDFDIRVVDEFGDQVPWALNSEQRQEEVFEFQLTVLCSET